MPYASKQAMIDRFSLDELVQLTDRATPPAGVLDDVVLGAALDAADAEINGYLQTRYALPLVSVPLIISNLALHMSRYNLYDDQPSDHVETRYKDTIKTLKAISTGVVRLGLDALNKTTKQTNLPEISGPKRTFDRTNMVDY